MNDDMTTELRDAIASAIEEAVLRVTDGTTRFDDQQLRGIADEFLWGEVFGRQASIEPGARSVRILLTEQVIAPQNRRPAPTVDEVWAAHPELHARQQEHLGSEDPDERQWALVPQPLYSPDTPAAELPQRIIRQCCLHKSCGGTDLYLKRTDDAHGPYYGYYRGSNDEPHGPGGSTAEEIVTQLNDPQWWPNRTGPWVFDCVGEDGFDALGPAED